MSSGTSLFVMLGKPENPERSSQQCRDWQGGETDLSRWRGSVYSRKKSVRILQSQPSLCYFLPMCA
ncbi:rCG27628, isoform CRA_a [Rattus norvegicus]|uniref:RCG27628, isoform CRA_a n=1 Tax=Rattus norvegicus TaxID=10116 RepID=A6KBL7_RAT|nr:rCG27628, isoform CRA_a [Rattus norvegicus]